jgi:hypothetical protein
MHSHSTRGKIETVIVEEGGHTSDFIGARIMARLLIFFFLMCTA